jgi:hypothetical protein
MDSRNTAGVPPEDAYIRNYEQRVAARSQANADPLPGPLKTCFAAPPVTACGLTFRELDLGDPIRLQRLGSPLWLLLSSLGGDQADPKFTLPQIYDLVFLLITPAARCDELLDGCEPLAVSHEPAAHRPQPSPWRQAVDARMTGLQLPLASIPELMTGIRQVLARAFGTAVNIVPAAVEGDGDSGFPLPPAGPTTASAGGSTSTPRSAGRSA